MTTAWRCICGSGDDGEWHSLMCVASNTPDGEWYGEEQPPIEVGTPVLGETTDGLPIRLAVTAVAADGTITVGVANSEKTPEAWRP